MMSGETLKKPSTSSPIRTKKIIENLKQLSAGWGGTSEYKKPAAKAVRKLDKVLGRLEHGRMPWPTVTAVASGCLILTWVSLSRDILLNIDADGDVQFTTSLKKIDAQTFEVIDRLDSEGAVTDLLTLDHMMAWYSQDTASSC